MTFPNWQNVAEVNRWYGLPKICTRCNRLLTNAHFKCAMQRGRLVQRSWCTECLNAYYRSPELKARRKIKKRRPGETFNVLPVNNHVTGRYFWRIIGKVNGRYPRILSDHDTEGLADQAIAEFLGNG